MGNPTTHFLVFCIMVVAISMLQCLLMGSATALDHENYHTISVENFKWKEPHKFAKCPASFAGHEALKPGMKIRLDHIHGACSPLRPINSSSWIDLVSQIFERDNARLNTISRSKNSSTYSPMSDVPLQPGRKVGTGNYILTVGFGTPAKNMLLIIDTGSDVTWIQCNPCSDCYSQVDPMFNPQQSSSYKHLPCLSAACTQLATAEGNLNTCGVGGCVYEVNYRDGSTTHGDFSYQTFTLGSDSFQSFAFGCGHTNTGLFKGSAGLLGLGRTALAFPAQTKSKYGGQFTYCLPDFLSSTSTGSFSVGQGSIPDSAVFTPLVSNSMYTSYYFVGLNGISVGGQRLSITPAVLGRGGTIVDSGTVITRLVPQAYNALKTSFRSQTQNLPSAQPYLILDTCYDLSSYSQVRVPIITFHFQNNANVSVSGLGILFPVKSDRSQVCLALAPASQSDSVNIIGNYQQQRMRVAFDTKSGRVGLASGTCAA
eukprot:PITA_11383